MKQQFNTAAHRETATTIRDAIMAKSVTAQMVGGTMLGLVEATSEIIEALGNLETERVTVKVNAYDGTGRVSVAGAKVYIDIFCNSGVPNFSVPRKEVEVDENGEVSFDVYKGFRYAVFSKLTGMAASFQLVFEACQDARTINLWNLPIGVKYMGWASLGIDTDDDTIYRYVPFVFDTYTDEFSELAAWDADEEADEYSDECYLAGILVATENTSFVIPQNSKAANTMQWCANRDFSKIIPTLPAFNPGTCEDWEAAQAAARADYDGAMNTEKILSACYNPKAADYCASLSVDYYLNCFLPSAGQLYLMYLNKAAINALMEDANDEGCSFDLIDDYWYWSSTQYDQWCAWYVYLGYGYTNSFSRTISIYVRAVSALRFDV